MANNNKKTVFAGDPQYKQYDLTNPENYEKDYEFPYADKIQKILEFPGIEDMAGVIVRGIFKNERQLNAVLRLAYRHRKFGDTNHQELLRMKVAGTAAVGGVGRLDALFTAVNLIASDMYRTARNMPNARGEEKVLRGSDFREKREETGVVSH